MFNEQLCQTNHSVGQHCMQDKQLNEGAFQMATAGSKDYDVVS